MKKLLVLAFVVTSAVACSKSKPATTTPPAAAQPDAKMEGAGKDGDKPAGEATPDKPADGKPTADPCAAP
ncbi:MAG: hypothetical protein ABI867_36115 [Kofleriaceae bacterium]